MTKQEEIQALKISIRLKKLKRKRMVLSRGLAKEAPKPEPMGMGESFVRGTGQGLSAGFIDEGTALVESLFTDKTYKQALAESRASYEQAEKQNPISYNVGDYGSSIAAALATGGGSAVVAGGAAVAKLGFKEALKQGAMKLGKETLRSAAVSGVEGVGRSKHSLLDAEGRAGVAKDAMFAGTIGALAPSALKIGGKAIKTAIPIPMQGKRIINNLAAKISHMRGAEQDVARTYKRMLNNPQEHKAARRAGDKFEEEFESKYLPSVKKFKDDIDDAVTAQYDKQTAQAYKEMAGDVTALRDDASMVVNAALKKVETLPRVYSSKAREVLLEARDRLNFKSPEVYDLQQTISKMAPKEADAAYEQVAGSLVTETKRSIYRAMKFAGREGGRDPDEKILKEISKALNKITHNPEKKGGRMMEKADKLWTDYEDMGRPMLDNFTGKNPDGLATSTIYQWAKDTKGVGKPVRRQKKHSMEKFLDKYEGKIPGAGRKVLDDFEGVLRPLRDYQDLGAMRATTGSNTGASTSMSIAATLTGAAILGTTQAAAIAGALSLPLMQPGIYSRAIGIARDFVDTQGEAAAKDLFGKGWLTVKRALAAGVPRAAQRGAAREDPFGASNLYESFDFGEGSTITPRR